MNLTQIKVWLVTILFFIATFANAANLTLTTYYANSGGLAGNLNTVGDMVNGNPICPVANDYTNATPGCDMSADVGYNNNGTADPSDDHYTGDLIVRTNDSFEVGTSFNWTGNAGGAEEEVTLTGTLPAGTGFIWEALPPFCDVATSSISADKKTLTCVWKDFDTTDTGSFSATPNFPVKVEGDAVNGSTPGDISFTIDAPNAAQKSDGVQDGNAANLMKVTAAPRWNLKKSIATIASGKQDPNGIDGYYITYKYNIEVNEIAGVNDTVNPSLGNEALDGGADASVSFVDDLSGVAPNAKLVTWEPASVYFDANSPCDVDKTSFYNEPYAASDLPGANAQNSIPSPQGTMTVTCTQAGANVNISIDHIDSRLTNAPTVGRNGNALAVTNKTAAIGTMRIFIPYSDIQNGADGISGTADDGVKILNNYMTGFDPDGISGSSNFGSAIESEVDNHHQYTLKYTNGSTSKNYTAGWSDQADQKVLWGGNPWYQPPTDATAQLSGDGTVTAGGRWGSNVSYINTGISTQNNVELCDVIDINTFEMEVLSDVDNPNTSLDDSKHAVDLEYKHSNLLPGFTIEYANGYVAASWPPDPNTAPNDIVANECNSSSVTWYPDFVTAKAAADLAGTAVSKVRIKADSLPSTKALQMRIKHKARSTYLGTNTPIPNGTLLVNYRTAKSPYYGNTYQLNYYVPKDASQAHQGAGYGDRLIYQQAKARISKTMSPTSVGLGDEVNVTLNPSFTVDGPTQTSGTLKVVDVLPGTLNYKPGSMMGTYGAGSTAYPEPTIYPATTANCNLHAAAVVAQGHPCGGLNGGTGNESILVWDFGTQTTGTVYGDMNFTVTVREDATAGTSHNYAQIESNLDDSNTPLRVANANVDINVPAALLLIKSVPTPLHEVNKGSLNNWLHFHIGARNGSTVPLNEVDIIDIIPFNGDGVNGSFTFTPQAVALPRDRQPNPTNYHGTFVFDSVSMTAGAGCDTTNIEYWYTNATTPLDVSPRSTSNTQPSGAPTAIWCQGTATGPAAACGYTNAAVTAVRTRKAVMPGGGYCEMQLVFATQDNFTNDIYANTAGISAKNQNNGASLDGTLSNTVYAQVYGSAIGDKVWIDTNADGIQNGGESGKDGVTVKLYDSN